MHRVTQTVTACRRLGQGMLPARLSHWLDVSYSTHSLALRAEYAAESDRDSANCSVGVNCGPYTIRAAASIL
jgi:hypothetical protein